MYRIIASNACYIVQSSILYRYRTIVSKLKYIYFLLLRLIFASIMPVSELTWTQYNNMILIIRTVIVSVYDSIDIIIYYYNGTFIAPGQPFLIVCDQGRSNFTFFFLSIDFTNGPVLLPGLLNDIAVKTPCSYIIILYSNNR